MVFKKKTNAGKKALLLVLVMLGAQFFAYWSFQTLTGQTVTFAESALFTAWHVIVEGLILFIASYILLEQAGRKN